MKRFIIFGITTVIALLTSLSCDSDPVQKYCEKNIVKECLKSPGSYKKVGWSSLHIGNIKREYEERLEQAEKKKSIAEMKCQYDDSFEAFCESAHWKNATEMLAKEIADTTNHLLFGISRLKFLAKNPLGVELAGTFDVVVAYGKEISKRDPIDRILAYRFNEDEWVYLQPSAFRTLTEVYDKSFEFSIPY